MRTDPKSVKIQSINQCLLALLGPTSIKAGCKFLMKLTPEPFKASNQCCLESSDDYFKKEK